MTKILARIALIPFAVAALYYLFVAMACWTPECFQVFHPGLLLTAIITVAFLILLQFAFPNQ